MILLFSERTDYTTKLVTEWLHKYQKKFLVSYMDDESTHIRILSVLGNDLHFSIGKKELQMSEVTAIWYRRGYLKLKKEIKLESKYTQMMTDLIDHHIAYTNALEELFEYYIHKMNIRVLGKNKVGRINKVKSIIEAGKIGLKTPEQILTSKKKELTLFQQQYGKIITKSLDINFNHYNDVTGCWEHQYTTLLTQGDIEGLPDTFPASVFQQYIEKQLEIRSFFMNDKFFSMGIFSQGESETNVDYRRYKKEKMNRVVPFQLPINIEDRLIRLHAVLGLNTASIDLICTPEGDFYFLETNPVGQFGYLSALNNYNIEKEIAEFIST